MLKLFATIFSLLAGFTLVGDFRRLLRSHRWGKDIKCAINIIEQSRYTHLYWARPGPRPPKIGEPKFHQDCIRNYDFVLSVLQQCRKEKKP